MLLVYIVVEKCSTVKIQLNNMNIYTSLRSCSRIYAETSTNKMGINHEQIIDYSHYRENLINFSPLAGKRSIFFSCSMLGPGIIFLPHYCVCTGQAGSFKFLDK